MFKCGSLVGVKSRLLEGIRNVNCRLAFEEISSRRSNSVCFIFLLSLAAFLLLIFHNSWSLSSNYRIINSKFIRGYSFVHVYLTTRASIRRAYRAVSARVETDSWLQRQLRDTFQSLLKLFCWIHNWCLRSYSTGARWQNAVCETV